MGESTSRTTRRKSIATVVAPVALVGGPSRLGELIHAQVRRAALAARRRHLPHHLRLERFAVRHRQLAALAPWIHDLAKRHPAKRQLPWHRGSTPRWKRRSAETPSAQRQGRLLSAIRVRAGQVKGIAAIRTYDCTMWV